MPELPEVETMCRGIYPIRGRKISRISKPKCSYRPISISPTVKTIDQRLSGHPVTKISRLGKRVLIHVADHVLILQPKMTGMVSLDGPPDQDHNRLQIEFAGRPSLKLLFWDRRGLGTVEMMPEDHVEQRIIAGKLGPDALSISLEDFAARLNKTRRAIKVALLDQKLVAGVGNLYASEMLHVSKINPTVSANEISRAKIKRLHKYMLEILNRAIEHEGSTLSDGTYRTALNDPGNYQNQHLVYDRARLPCPTCKKSKIERIVQAQRSTFFCPKCQPG